MLKDKVNVYRVHTKPIPTLAVFQLYTVVITSFLII